MVKPGGQNNPQCQMICPVHGLKLLISEGLKTTVIVTHIMNHFYIFVEPGLYVKAPADARGFTDKPRPIGRGGRR